MEGGVGDMRGMEEGLKEYSRVIRGNDRRSTSANGKMTNGWGVGRLLKSMKVWMR